VRGIVKEKIRMIAIVIMLIFALHAMIRGLEGINIAGIVVGFLLFLYVTLQKGKPSPAPLTLTMPERTPQPKI
jgi:hypothetical protein